VRGFTHAFSLVQTNVGPDIYHVVDEESVDSRMLNVNMQVWMYEMHAKIYS